MAKLRLSLTLPGAVSLGAYEGGALAALLVAVQELGESNVVVDSIACASAGSMTGLLAAGALLRGADPIKLFTEAWVKKPSIKAMMRHPSTDSPLSSDACSAIAHDVLGAMDEADGPYTTRQREPILLSMALTSLAGLTYTLPTVARETPVQASTYLDWYSTKLTHHQEPNDYVDLAERAIASGSNPIGFPPKKLDRSKDRAAYEAAGLEGFPADGLFWYSDGGAVDNEPIGRTIDLAAEVRKEVGKDDPRLFLLIHPDPAAPSPGYTMWSGDAPLPPWLRAAARAFSISRTQSIYEDLKRLEKVNSRLQWSNTVAGAIAAAVDGAALAVGLSDEQAKQLQAHLASKTTQALDDIRAKRRSVEDVAHRAPRDVHPAPKEFPALLATLMQAATGLEDKHTITVEVVSPTIDPEVAEPPAKQLAGAFLFHFGGFFDVRFRQNDFALGYRNMQYWLVNCLAYYLPDVDLTTALKVVDSRYQDLGWNDVDCAGAQFRNLSTGEKKKAVRLAAHIAHVIGHDLHSRVKP